MVRSFQKERQFSSKLWGEAAQHSIYILNRLPTRSLSGETPYEAWMGRKPELGHIRVFGCVAHMMVPSVHTKKLDNRSKMVVHLGKEPCTKAYRLYALDTDIVHISRNVIFEESKAWPWDI